MAEATGGAAPEEEPDGTKLEAQPPKESAREVGQAESESGGGCSTRFGQAGRKQRRRSARGGVSP